MRIFEAKYQLNCLCTRDYFHSPFLLLTTTRFQPVSNQSVASSRSNSFALVCHHSHFGRSFLLLFHCFCLLGTFLFSSFPIYVFFRHIFRSVILLTHTHSVCTSAFVCVRACVREPFQMHSHTLRKLYRREMNATIFMFVAMLYLFWKSFIRFDLKIITSIAPPTTNMHTHTHTRHVSISTSILKQWKVAHDVCYITLCTIDRSGSLTSHKTSELLFNNLPRLFYTHSSYVPSIIQIMH